MVQPSIPVENRSAQSLEKRYASWMHTLENDADASDLDWRLRVVMMQPGSTKHWLQSRNRYLNARRPGELIEKRKFDEALEALNKDYPV